MKIYENTLPMTEGVPLIIGVLHLVVFRPLHIKANNKRYSFRHWQCILVDFHLSASTSLFLVIGAPKATPALGSTDDRPPKLAASENVKSTGQFGYSAPGIWSNDCV